MTPTARLSRADLPSEPFQLFEQWYQEAISKNVKYPNAMTLATCTSDGFPSARVVLFKGLNSKGLCFYTNYESRKAQELIENPRAALVFYWPALDRQIRAVGAIQRVTEKESDDYWNSRPRGSQLSALSSQQSHEVSGRAELEKRLFELERKYEGQPVPRPDHWGGFCLIPQNFEFWMEGEHRLHDRFCFERQGDSWRITCLAP